MIALRGSTLVRSSISSELRPNTRLKLAAPGTRGKLSFVTNQVGRHSLSAVR